MNEIITLEFLKHRTIENNTSKEYQLFYVLYGTATMMLSDETFVMQKTDMIVINPQESFWIQGESALMVRVDINHRALTSLMGMQRKYIVCNTVSDHNENFDQLRYLLGKLINALYEEEYQKLLYQQYSFDFLSFLITQFSNNITIDLQEDQRKADIEAYIDVNYQSELSLETIAHRFGLTPQYFSTYFKEQFQMTFLKYVNQIRVENACDQLLHSDATILKIAMDQGFPNLTSFTRVFHATYGMNPGEYRLQHQVKEEGEEISLIEIKEFLQSKEPIMHQNQHLVALDVEAKKEKLDPYWFHLCNLGSVSQILKDGMKEQIRELQKELGFTYARISLDILPSTNVPTYYLEETVFDFLYEVHFRLFLVIDYRRYCEDAAHLSYLEGLLYHFINRYGFKNVSSWKFELFYDSDFHNQKVNAYRKAYDQITELLRRVGLDCKLAGPGILLEGKGENLREFLQHNPNIETLTLLVAPYSVRNKVNGEIFINRTTDTNYLLEQYESAQHVCEQFPNVKQIMIVNWKDALNDINILNDSCYRASRILYNTFKGYGIIDTMALDKSLDLMSDHVVDNHILSGLPGLISRKGVKKPSFYAYKFLKKLDQFVLYKDEHLIATGSDKKYLQIVCHNCKKLNYKYYLEEQEVCKTENITEYYEDGDELKLTLRFQHLMDGRYIVKYRSIKEDEGSALTKWLDMKFENNSFFGIDELDYLTSVSKPSIKGSVEVVKDGLLEIVCHLAPNEIKHIHLIYQHKNK